MALFKDKILVVIGLNSLENLQDVGGGGGVEGPGSESIPASSARLNFRQRVPSTKTLIDQITGKNVLEKADDICKKAKNIHDDLRFVEMQ